MSILQEFQYLIPYRFWALGVVQLLLDLLFGGEGLNEYVLLEEAALDLERLLHRVLHDAHPRLDPFGPLPGIHAAVDPGHGTPAMPLVVNVESFVLVTHLPLKDAPAILFIVDVLASIAIVLLRFLLI